MNRLALVLILLLGAAAATAWPADISFLLPSAAPPGSTVQLGGNDWPSTFHVRLGNAVVQADRVSADEVRFMVPELPPGRYLIGLFDAEGRLLTANRMPLDVIAPAPAIESLVPDIIPYCRETGPAEIEVDGRQFAPDASLLLDDTALSVSVRSATSLSAQLPPLAAGHYRIQVVNPDGQTSLAVPLTVDQRPVIEQIEVGGDQVVTYQIRIVGLNFTPESRLVLNGTQLANRSLDVAASNDRVSYLDCTTLVYQRYPVTGQPKDLAFQVINPDGQISNTVVITAN